MKKLESSRRHNTNISVSSTTSAKKFSTNTLPSPPPLSREPSFDLDEVTMVQGASNTKDGSRDNGGGDGKVFVENFLADVVDETDILVLCLLLDSNFFIFLLIFRFSVPLHTIVLHIVFALVQTIPSDRIS
jgi:hypothetical protein